MNDNINNKPFTSDDLFAFVCSKEVKETVHKEYASFTEKDLDALDFSYLKFNKYMFVQIDFTMLINILTNLKDKFSKMYYIDDLKKKILFDNPIKYVSSASSYKFNMVSMDGAIFTITIAYYEYISKVFSNEAPYLALCSVIKGVNEIDVSLLAKSIQDTLIEFTDAFIIYKEDFSDFVLSTETKKNYTSKTELAEGKLLNGTDEKSDVKDELNHPINCIKIAEELLKPSITHDDVEDLKKKASSFINNRVIGGIKCPDFSPLTKLEDILARIEIHADVVRNSFVFDRINEDTVNELIEEFPSIKQLVDFEFRHIAMIKYLTHVYSNTRDIVVYSKKFDYLVFYGPIEYLTKEYVTYQYSYIQILYHYKKLRATFADEYLHNGGIEMKKWCYITSHIFEYLLKNYAEFEVMNENPTEPKIMVNLTPIQCKEYVDSANARKAIITDKVKNHNEPLYTGKLFPKAMDFTNLPPELDSVILPDGVVYLHRPEVLNMLINKWKDVRINALLLDHKSELHDTFHRPICEIYDMSEYTDAYARLISYYYYLYKKYEEEKADSIISFASIVKDILETLIDGYDDFTISTKDKLDMDYFRSNTYSSDVNLYKEDVDMIKKWLSYKKE